MSDTPRTDKEVFVAVARPDVDLEAVDADFARTLERENAALREALEEAFAESDDTVRFHIIRNAVNSLKEANP